MHNELTLRQESRWASDTHHVIAADPVDDPTHPLSSGYNKRMYATWRSGKVPELSTPRRCPMDYAVDLLRALWQLSQEMCACVCACVCTVPDNGEVWASVNATPLGHFFRRRSSFYRRTSELSRFPAAKAGFTAGSPGPHRRARSRAVVRAGQARSVRRCVTCTTYRCARHTLRLPARVSCVRSEMGTSTFSAVLSLLLCPGKRSEREWLVRPSSRSASTTNARPQCCPTSRCAPPTPTIAAESAIVTLLCRQHVFTLL